MTDMRSGALRRPYTAMGITRQYQPSMTPTVDILAPWYILSIPQPLLISGLSPTLRSERDSPTAQQTDKTRMVNDLAQPEQHAILPTTCRMATYSHVRAVILWKMPSGRAMRAFPPRFLFWGVEGTRRAEQRRHDTLESLLATAHAHLQGMATPPRMQVAQSRSLLRRAMT